MRGSRRRCDQAGKRHSGFTLIEVLIVVVIMAVLAATIIPQFSSSATDAKESSAKFNLHSLRSQIELYKIHHTGAIPSGANNLEQLTKNTDATGAVGTGVNFPYGPYLQGAIPANPFNGKATVRAAAATPAIGTGADGWIYNTTTGEVKLDTTDVKYYAF
jgi:general secretion pathway protein G